MAGGWGYRVEIAATTRCEMAGLPAIPCHCRTFLFRSISIPVGSMAMQKCVRQGDLRTLSTQKSKLEIDRTWKPGSEARGSQGAIAVTIQLRTPTHHPRHTTPAAYRNRSADVDALVPFACAPDPTTTFTHRPLCQLHFATRCRTCSLPLSSVLPRAPPTCHAPHRRVCGAAMGRPAAVCLRVTTAECRPHCTAPMCMRVRVRAGSLPPRLVSFAVPPLSSQSLGGCTHTHAFAR